MSSDPHRRARRIAALVMVVLAGVSFAIARASDGTGPVRRFETSVLIPAIAVLMVVMAGYLIRGRSAGQPLVLTHLKWKYRVLMITAVAGAAITWALALARPHEFLIAAYLPAVLANLIFNLFERGTPPVPSR